MLDRIGSFTADRRWIWPLAGIVILWIILVGLTDRFSLYNLTGVATSASFLLLQPAKLVLDHPFARGRIRIGLEHIHGAPPRENQ